MLSVQSQVNTAASLHSSSLLISQSYATNQFVTLGDWGGAALGSYYLADVTAVSESIASTVLSEKPQFVVNTGDSFYWCGIQNLQDFQISEDYESVFSEETLAIPWYGVLGNHEYGNNR